MVKPKIIAVQGAKTLLSLKKRGVRFENQQASQLDELAEIRHPELRDAPAKLASVQRQFRRNYRREAVYAYLPWRNLCIKMVSEPLFHELVTARNKNLITATEQAVFSGATVAIAGLSVGSNIARLCRLQGGAREMNIADPDAISTSNLNRILAGIAAINKPKTTVLAEALYELDPFSVLHLFNQGITAENSESFFFCRKKKITVLVEEVDQLPIKIKLRQVAERLKVPVVSITDNGDGVLVDVERYDKGYKFANFSKRLESLPPRPTILSTRDKAIAITKFIGADVVPYRMLASIFEVGKTLYSWPQLGGAAVLAGVVGAFCIRQIVTVAPLPSGRYAIDLGSCFQSFNKDEQQKKRELLSFFS